MKVPQTIFNYRHESCRICPTPCELQGKVEFIEEGENECGAQRWGKYQTFVKNKRAIRGLGDFVAMVAEPIAEASDAVLNTKLKGCQACAKRREMLNHLIPWGQKTE